MSAFSSSSDWKQVHDEFDCGGIVTSIACTGEFKFQDYDLRIPD